MTTFQKTGFITGIVLAMALIFTAELDPAKPEITKMAAIAVLMATWWITEAIPLAATSLLPLVLFPILGILDGNLTANSYINSTIFLFLGGFILAIGMEKWNLHKRLALKIITLFGGSPVSIVMGFMIATFFLSMWISNTATAVMMLPIALAIMHNLEEDFGIEKTHNFSVVLMLGIAYSCSIGGICTLIGTPPNLSFVRISKIIFPDSPEVSFGNWMILAFPIGSIMLLIAMVILFKGFYKIDKDLKLDPDFIKNEYTKLGKISLPEKSVGIIFTITAFLWVFRADLNLGILTIPGWQNILGYSQYINDGVVAIAMSLLLFIIPAGNGEKLLDQKAFGKVPWGIILLFGGGFALAQGFTTSGLSQYIGDKFSIFSNIPSILIVAAAAFVVNFLTELTSNTATAEMMLPIMASAAVALGIHPYLLMISATISASMGFMLPAATPPNTIVFSSERLKVTEMAKAGFVLNWAGILVVTLIIYLLGELLFDLNIFPDWAVIK